MAQFFRAPAGKGVRTMDDEYTQMKRELEEIDTAVETLKSRIRGLMRWFRRSDHPLRQMRVAELRKLLDQLS